MIKGKYGILPRSWELMFTILKIWKLWRKHPHLRFGQFVINVMRDTDHDAYLYFSSDEQFFAKMESYYEQHTNSIRSK